MELKRGKMKEIGARFGITSQGVSQILSGRRPESTYAKAVKAAAYEAGGLINMAVSFETEKGGNVLMVCSWSDGAVQLIHSRATDTVYKYVCGEQVEAWQGLSIPEFIQKQKACERLAAINY